MWGDEKLARQNAAPERLEACAHTHVWAVCQRVVAVALFTRQVQITVACFDGNRTHDGPARTGVSFFIAVDSAGERIRGVVILAKQTKAVADFPLQAAAHCRRVAFITVVRVDVDTFTADG